MHHTKIPTTGSAYNLSKIIRITFTILSHLSGILIKVSTTQPCVKRIKIYENFTRYTKFRTTESANNLSKIVRITCTTLSHLSGILLKLSTTQPCVKRIKIYENFTRYIKFPTTGSTYNLSKIIRITFTILSHLSGILLKLSP